MSDLLSTPVSADAVRAWVLRLQSEFAEPGRARWLAIGAGAAIWLAVVLGMSSAIDLERRKQDAARAEIARLSLLVEDRGWDARLMASRDLRAKLDDRFWPAPTAGLAEASFEAWLRERFQNHGIEVQQVLIARTPLDGTDVPAGGVPAPGIEKLSAKVISTFRAKGIIEVAADAAEKDKIVTIDRLIIRTGRNARLEMDVSTFLRRQ